MSNENENKPNSNNDGVNPNGKEHLPVVPGSSQSAEVVKQIIEQILANEHRRARMEFIRLSIFFLVFIFVMLGSGVWFARQLLFQLREERQLTEQTWRAIVGHGAITALPPDAEEIRIPPALDREEVARIENNINAVSEFLKSKPHDSSASIRKMLERQQEAIQALSARLNDTAGNTGTGPAVSRHAKKNDFISSSITEDVQLRMPIPSL